VQNASQSRAAAGRANGEPLLGGTNKVFFKPSEITIVAMAPRRVVMCFDCSSFVFAKAASITGKYVNIKMDIDSICQRFIFEFWAVLNLYT
jgi:hypothetical protein